jgi:hypothetical protein
MLEILEPLQGSGAMELEAAAFGGRRVLIRLSIIRYLGSVDIHSGRQSFR